MDATSKSELSSDPPDDGIPRKGVLPSPPRESEKAFNPQTLFIPPLASYYRSITTFSYRGSEFVTSKTGLSSDPDPQNKGLTPRKGGTPKGPLGSRSGILNPEPCLVHPHSEVFCMRRYDIAVQWLHYLSQVRIFLGPQSPQPPPFLRLLIEVF